MFWVTTAVLVALPVSFNTLSAAGNPQGSSIPVRFLDNKEVSLNLYPAGYKAAAVLTATGINGENKLGPVKRLVFLLANRGLKGTFFLSVTETLRKDIADTPPRIELLGELSRHNYEIAQDCPVIFPPGTDGPAAENGISQVAEKRLVKKIQTDRQYLLSLGLKPRGCGGEDAPPGSVISVLKEWGDLYICIFRPDPKEVPGGGISPDERETRAPLYPEYIEDCKILKFTASCNPVLVSGGGRAIVDRFAERGGVLLYQVDLSYLPAEEELARIKQFINHLEERNVWSCSLGQLSAWWTARREVEIRSRREDNALVITYHNPSRFTLENARLIFKSSPDSPPYYRVENREGMMSSEGKIPDRGFVNVTLFSDDG